MKSITHRLPLSVLIFFISITNAFAYTLTDKDVKVVDGFITAYTSDTKYSNLVIPETLNGQTIIGIGPEVFFFKNISTLSLPSSLKHIEQRAFYKNNISTITIPKSVKSIGEFAFEDNKITSITFEENSNLGSIQARAFFEHNCDQITLPNSLGFIGFNAFHSTTANFTLNLPLGFDHWMNQDSITLQAGDEIKEHGKYHYAQIEHTLNDADVVVENGVIVYCDYNFQASHIVIPETLQGQTITGIGDGVFNHKNIIKIELPNTLTTIGNSAFEYSLITALRIPNSVEKIGSSAFFACRISTLDISTSSQLSQIKDAAFEQNDIKAINLPTNLKELGAHAFNGNKISQVNGEAFDGIFYARTPEGTIDYSTIVSCGNYIKSPLMIREGVTTIGEYTFRGQSAMPSVTFPSTLEYIGTAAFTVCNALTELTFPASLTVIGERSFTNCRTLSSINLNACTKLTRIEDEAFMFCSLLDNIDLSHNTALTHIGKFAFRRIKDKEFNLPVNTTLPGYKWYTNTNLCFENGDLITNLYLSYILYKDHKITFKDWDNSIIATKTVEHASQATPPTLPSRTGYTFSKWDIALDHITRDTTATAQYTINSYVVSFLNWDNTLIAKDTAEYLNAASAPTAPVRENYTFKQWDHDFSSLTQDLTVKAEFEINSYLIRFLDWDNTVLKVDTVAHGGTATPPSNPQREGYSFKGWDTALDNMTADLSIFAQYEKSSAIKEQSINSIDLYPNPASLFITIEHERGNTVKVYTMHGQLLLSTICESEKQSIDISHLKTGLYIIQTAHKTRQLCIE